MSKFCGLFHFGTLRQWQPIKWIAAFLCKMLREIDTFKTDSKVHLNNIHDLLLQLKIKHFAHLRFLCSTGYKYSNIGQKKKNLFVSFYKILPILMSCWVKRQWHSLVKSNMKIWRMNVNRNIRDLGGYNLPSDQY